MAYNSFIHSPISVKLGIEPERQLSPLQLIYLPLPYWWWIRVYLFDTVRGFLLVDVPQIKVSMSIEESFLVPQSKFAVVRSKEELKNAPRTSWIQRRWSDDAIYYLP